MVMFLLHSRYCVNTKINYKWLYCIWFVDHFEDIISRLPFHEQPFLLPGQVAVMMIDLSWFEPP